MTGKHDAPGASPRRYGAPVATGRYYLDRILGNTEESHAPPPPTGAGLAEGADDCQNQRLGARLALYPFFILGFLGRTDNPVDFTPDF